MFQNVIVDLCSIDINQLCINFRNINSVHTLITSSVGAAISNQILVHQVTFPRDVIKLWELHKFTQ